MEQSGRIEIACMYRKKGSIEGMINIYKQRLSILYYLFFPLFYIFFAIVYKKGKEYEYTHCEICFPDIQDESVSPQQQQTNSSSDEDKPVVNASPRMILAFGVTHPGCIFRKYRTFGTPEYRWLHLVVSKSERDAIYDSCNRDYLANKDNTYDTTGLVMSYTFPRQKLLKNKLWCVSWIIKKLQAGGKMRYYRETAQSTDDLVMFLRNDTSSVVQSIPVNVSTDSLLMKEYGVLFV